MLTPRENLLETIHGGNPERYVNQFEPFKILWGTPQDIRYTDVVYGGNPVKNCWGVTVAFPEGTPGPFPVHDEEHLVLKDITRWREYVEMPSVDFTEEEWKPFIAEAESVDREQFFVTQALWPGLFENCHNLMSMEECMVNLYEEPEAMHELIAYLTKYELKLADQICAYIKPDAVYRHDDWGSQKSTFMSKSMFREFFLEPTKKIYQYYRDHGVKVIIHHSDSYGETLVPEMIEMGIDIWQGAMSTNNLPEIAENYKGHLTIMGGIDNGRVDRADWTKETVSSEVRRICQWVNSKYFIPNTTFGGDASTYEGVYQTVSEAICKINYERAEGQEGVYEN